MGPNGASKMATKCLKMGSECVFEHPKYFLKMTPFRSQNGLFEGLLGLKPCLKMVQNVVKTAWKRVFEHRKWSKVRLGKTQSRPFSQPILDPFWGHPFNFSLVPLTLTPFLTAGTCCRSLVAWCLLAINGGPPQTRPRSSSLGTL